MKERILYEPPEGEIVKIDKFVLNKANNQYLNAVVVIIERIDEIPHYRISTGGTNEFRIIGHEQWQQFLDFLNQANWVSQKTIEWQLPEDSEPIEDTWDRKLNRKGNTLVDLNMNRFV